MMLILLQDGRALKADTINVYADIGKISVWYLGENVDRLDISEVSSIIHVTQ